MTGAMLLDVLMPVMTATDSSNLPDPAQWGLMGIAIAVLASGRIVVPKPWLTTEQENTKTERARGDRLEEEIKRLNALMAEKTIPALTESTNAVKEVAVLVHDATRDRGLDR